MKKLLLTSALVVGFASSAFAGVDLTVRLGGHIDTQLGFRSQKSAFKVEDPNVDGFTIGEIGTALVALDNVLLIPKPWYSPKLNEFALVNDTKIKINIDGRDDTYGFKFGGMIKLYADTSKAKEQRLQDLRFLFPTSEQLEQNIAGYELIDNCCTAPAYQTMAYFEGAFGRFELGSYTGATHAMKVDATTFARATGGANGDARYWWNKFTGNGDTDGNKNANFLGSIFLTRLTFLETPNLPTNEIGRFGIERVNAAKINYYTPNFNGFMAGFSYTPDLDSHGTITKAGSITKTIVNPSNNPWGFKNVWEGGIRYEGQFKDVSLKAALLGEIAEAKDYLNNLTTSTIAGVPFGFTGETHKDIRAWEAGFNLSYMAWTVGGSYGDWNKSGARKIKNAYFSSGGPLSPSKTHYWTAGVGYEYGPFAASLTYFQSKSNVAQFYNDGNGNDFQNNGEKNKLETLTFGMDYKFAPGLMPYFEITAFRFKDKTPSINWVNNTVIQGKEVESNKGTIILIGSKLNF